MYFATRSVRQSEPVFDLTGVRGLGDVGDGDILGLAKTVADYRRVFVLLCEFDGVEGFGEGTDFAVLPAENAARIDLGG